MLHRRVRKVLHCDLTVGATPNEAPRQPVARALQILRSCVQEGSAVHLYNRQQAAIRVSRVGISNQANVAALLIQNANIDTADPAFSNLKTGTLRVEPKLSGEGVAVSAHLLVNLAPNSHSTNVHHAVLEIVPSLTRTYVQAGLSGILRRIGQYDFEDLNGVRRAARPRIELLPRLSERFLQDLSQGRLGDITLIKRENASDLFDDDPDIIVREGTLKIGTARKLSGASAVKTLNSVINRGRADGWTNVRVAYTDYDGTPKTTQFAIDYADSIDSFVGKKSQITADSDLSQCEAEIRQDMVIKMRQLLNQPNSGRSIQ